MSIRSMPRPVLNNPAGSLWILGILVSACSGVSAGPAQPAIAPEDQPADGVNLIPFIKRNGESNPHEWLCWQNRSWLPRKEGGFVMPTPKIHNCAIRKGTWKLVRLNENIDSNDRAPAWQLYDLASDIGEQNDVAGQHDGTVKELSALFDQWRSSMHPTVE